jgi:competence protein ComEA
MKRFAIAAVVSMMLLPVMRAEDLPDGKGRKLADDVCGACHTTDVIFDFRNDMTDRDAWRGKVDEMVGRGAELKKEEIEAIVDYFMKYMGPPVNVNKASAADLQKELDLSAPEAQAVVQYRTDKGSFKDIADLGKVPGLSADKFQPFKIRLKF